MIASEIVLCLHHLYRITTCYAFEEPTGEWPQTLGSAVAKAVYFRGAKSYAVHLAPGRNLTMLETNEGVRDVEVETQAARRASQ